MRHPHTMIESKCGINRWSKPAAAAVFLAASAGFMSMPGCHAIGFFAESYRKDSTHEVKAEYTGLAGKSFALVVSVDRMVQADHPGLMDRLTGKITERLAAYQNNPRASGFVPARTVLKYQYDNPSWPSKPFGDLAAALGGADRLIHVEVIEYRLHDPGNPHEWDGVATATVGVIEADSGLPDQFVFEKTVSVRFPGKKGFNPSNMNASVVTTALSARLIDRVSWLFYDHQEPYYPEY
ncbi:MAG: hypothetical protein JNK25_11510 [Phycisphaerae bacterium]|nr:hypothetical protein [Phycisphaerae bacterium]